MRIYIVDDDERVCRTLTRILTRGGWEARCYHSPTAFLSTLDALDFGCVLLDIHMPEQNGLLVLSELAERRPAWPVVMVSGTMDVADAISSFRNGAVHMLRKPFRTAELLAAIKEAADIGHRRQLSHARRNAISKYAGLSAREREVLSQLAQGDQSKAIAWKLGLSVRTVDMHRSNILTKLSARNASQAVSVARDLNLL